jgi:uncharacterized membrane protein
MNQVSPQEHQGINEDNGIGRLNALSDGVFAIAMTLLLLNIEVPNNIRPTRTTTFPSSVSFQRAGSLGRPHCNPL